MSSTAPQFRGRLPRIAEAAVERARLTVVPRSRTTAPRFPFLVLVSLVLLAGVVGLLLFNTNMQQASFANRDLEQAAQRMAEREQVLKSELEKLRSSQHLAQAAQRMGMVVPPVTGQLDLATGTVSGELVAARPGDGLRLYDPAPRKPAAVTARRNVVVASAPRTNKKKDTTTRAERRQQRAARRGGNG